MLPTIELFGQKIYLYPLFMGLAWGSALNLILYYNSKFDLKIKRLKFILLMEFLSAWVGAKLLFIITSPETLKIPNVLNFWLGGGFVFYGGFLLAAIVTLIFVKLKFLQLSDLNFFIPPLLLGHAIGRLGCFFAGCCYGVYCELPWAIHLHGLNRHPVQLYESISLFWMFFFFHNKLLKTSKNIIWPMYMLMYGVVRFLLEFMRGDRIRGVYGLDLSTSQYVAIFMVVISMSYMLYRRKMSCSN